MTNLALAPPRFQRGGKCCVRFQRGGNVVLVSNEGVGNVCPCPFRWKRKGSDAIRVINIRKHLCIRGKKNLQ